MSRLGLLAARLGSRRDESGPTAHGSHDACLGHLALASATRTIPSSRSRLGKAEPAYRKAWTHAAGATRATASLTTRHVPTRRRRDAAADVRALAVAACDLPRGRSPCSRSTPDGGEFAPQSRAQRAPHAWRPGSFSHVQAAETETPTVFLRPAPAPGWHATARAVAFAPGITHPAHDHAERRGSTLATRRPSDDPAQPAS